MATLEEISASINSAYHTYMAELVLAGADWEKKPAGAGSGEDAWSARQVAEHICGSGGFFAAGVARAIGAKAAPPAPSVLTNVAEAVAAMPSAHAKLTAVLAQLKSEQLEIEMEFGPLGKTNVEKVFGIVSYHYKDHASQLKTLRG